VGPWCFLDRFGPLTFDEGKPMDRGTAPAHRAADRDLAPRRRSRSRRQPRLRIGAAPGRSESAHSCAEPETSPPALHAVTIFKTSTVRGPEYEPIFIVIDCQRDRGPTSLTVSWACQ
jgi:hypothetical protein